MFLTSILHFAKKMMFARIDFYTCLVYCSGDLSDNESEEKPSVAICGGSICILTGLLMEIGRAFHNRGPTTLNERSPKLTRFVGGSFNGCWCDERARPV